MFRRVVLFGTICLAAVVWFAQNYPTWDTRDKCRDQLYYSAGYGRDHWSAPAKSALTSCDELGDGQYESAQTLIAWGYYTTLDAPAWMK
jgi:hypothetical protein